MRLFTFAHGGEAQEFIRRDQFRPLPFFFPGLYQNDQQDLLLITGEGMWNCSEKVSAVCAHFKHHLQRIYNLGVAGCLDKSLPLNQIVEIRTCYQERGAIRSHPGEEEQLSMNFKSFTSSPLDKNLSSAPYVDCISTHLRILNEKEAEYLAYFAPVVDRELWALASVSHLFKIPFESFKLISDYAGSETLCLDIKESAALYSLQLYEYFDQNFSGTPPLHRPQLVIDKNLNSLKDFYFTTSQQRLFESLIHQLKIKYSLSADDILIKINLDQIKQSEKHPKKRTQILLEELNKLLSPFTSDLEKKLKILTSSLNEVGCKVEFTHAYEDDFINLKMTLKNQQDLVKFISSLNKFNLIEVQNLLNGNSIDV